MKTLRSLLIVLLLTLFLPSASHRAAARNFRGRQYALISYTFSIHPDVRRKITPFDGLFPQNPPNFSHIDPVYFRLKAMCFDMLKREFEREIDLFIMPLRTYGRRFKYDAEGYPSMLIEVAQRKADAKHYLAIDFRLLTSPESAAGVPGEKYQDSVLRPNDYLRPRVEITLTLYPRLGIVPSDRYTTAVQWMTPIRLEPTMLDGIINSKLRRDRTTLLEALRLGVQSLVEEIK